MKNKSWGFTDYARSMTELQKVIETKSKLSFSFFQLHALCQEISVHLPFLTAFSCLKSQLLSIYLFGVLRRFQHCTGHITTGSWKGRGNQYIQFVRVLYCKLPTNSKQLPAFPFEAGPGIEPRPQR